MDYDFRNRTSSPYDTPSTMHRSSTPSTAPQPNHPMYGPPSLYPTVNQPGHTVIPHAPRHHSFTQQATSSPSSGLGIRVMIKPEYRIAPPPQLTPQIVEIPRSSFQFDFELERQILAEAEKDSPNWSRLLGLENSPPKPLQPTSSIGPTADPVVRKYIAMGLNRDAVPLAVANYGDNPPKVQEFVNGYALLQEMGFPSNKVAEALLMYDNNTEEALAHFLNSS
ncbi:uncharacterized protein LOC133675880 [Populus nigra]|uniref:uncharacterized protein LOC133675880 n=1 Tax=Populus nigra TaxID=3691 RepID=UPI002B27B748|nr:uncharacterized protein LOC133675880 [Populus nigra]